MSPVCTDVPCVAVFLQTGFLSPYPVALLAADAFCDAPSLREKKKKKQKTLSLLPPPPPSELILTAGFGLMGSPYPP